MSEVGGALLWIWGKVSAIPIGVWLFAYAFYELRIVVRAFAAEMEKQTRLLEDIHAELGDLGPRAADDDDLP